MNYLVLPVLIAIAWTLGAGRAAAATASELLQSCEAVIHGQSPAMGRALDIPAVGVPCWYYMSAIQNMSVLVDPHREPLLGICAPPSTTLMDYVRIFVRYARRPPNGTEENAAAVAVEALNEAFPCGN
jgi:hypothetical protein